MPFNLCADDGACYGNVVFVCDVAALIGDVAREEGPRMKWPCPSVEQHAPDCTFICSKKSSKSHCLHALNRREGNVPLVATSPDGYA